MMPHGWCLQWSRPLMLLHVASDATIALSYFAIPGVIMYFRKRRPDLVFIHAVFVLFALFIVLCGTTHLLNIWTIWRPDYLMEGWVKAATAVVSASTAAVLIRVLPSVLRIESPLQLKDTVYTLRTKLNEMSETQTALMHKIEATTQLAQATLAFIQSQREKE